MTEKQLTKWKQENNVELIDIAANVPGINAAGLTMELALNGTKLKFGFDWDISIEEFDNAVKSFHDNELNKSIRFHNRVISELKSKLLK